MSDEKIELKYKQAKFSFFANSNRLDVSDDEKDSGDKTAGLLSLGFGEKMGGKIFTDINGNGENDTEDGIANVTVQIFECGSNGSSNLIETAVSDMNGEYQFTSSSILDGNDYRIEFSNIPLGFTSSVRGVDNATETLFTNQLSCNNDFGLINTSAVCPSPNLELDVSIGELFSTNTLLGPGIAVLTCGTITKLAASERYTMGILDLRSINMDNNRTEVNPSYYHHPSWHVDNIGNVYGVETDTAGNMYVTASSHYSNAFGYGSGANYAQGVTRYGNLGGGAESVAAAGAVYKIDKTTGVASLFATLPQLEFIFSHQACEAPDPPLERTTGVGLGNITYDPVNDQFFVSNFEDGKIYRLDRSGASLSVFDPQTLDDFIANDDNDAGLADDPKPYGLAVNRTGTRLYFGTHELDTSPGLYSVELDMMGDFSGTELFHSLYLAEGDIGGVFAPTPEWVAISDLEFTPDDKLVIGLRTGCAGNFATSHNHGATFYIASHSGDEIYDDFVNPDIQYPNDVTGNDDGYGGAGIWAKHDGTYDILVSSSDTRTEEGPHGMILFPHDYTNGNSSGFSLQPSAAIPYIPSFNDNDFKGVGGDVAVFSPCGEAPLQLGNYVWLDLNEDGVQDPCEEPVSGLTIKLYSKPTVGNSELVATTTTNSEGEYYFTNSATTGESWEPAFDKVEKDSSYYLVFCGDAYDDSNKHILLDSKKYIWTTANSGMGDNFDLNDSDVDEIVVNGFGSFPAICAMADMSYHSLDLGIIEVCEILEIETSLITCNNGNTPSDGSDDTINIFADASNNGSGPSNMFLVNAIDIVNEDTILYGPYTYGIGGVLFDIPNSNGEVKLEVFDSDKGLQCMRDTTLVQSCVCEISIISVTPSMCNDQNNEYSLEVRLDYGNLFGSDIMIETSSGYQEIFSPQGIGDDIFIINGLNSDGEADIDVSAYFLSDAGCYAELIDAYDAPALCSSIFCEVFIDKIAASGCYISGNQSTSVVNVQVSWQSIVGGQINVQIGSQTKTIVPGANVVSYADGSSGVIEVISPQVVAFELPADGSIHTAVAVYSGSGSCGDNRNFNLPAPCDPVPCTGNLLGGTVFADYNTNGTKDSEETEGLADVIVSAISSDGQVFTSETDATGVYTIFIPLDKYPVRVEFTALPELLGAGTPNGIDGNTTVQFVDGPACNVDLGIVYQADVCSTSPLLVVPCYISGDPQNAATSGTEAIIAFDYSESGPLNKAALTTVGTVGEVGATWGVAHNRKTNKLYASAVVKRHAGFGPLGIGGIYESDLNDLPSVNAVPFIDVVSDLGIDVGGSDIGTNATRGIVGGPGTPSCDETAFIFGAEKGIGDIDISTDGDSLYFVNLHDKKLYRIDISDYNENQILPTSTEVASFDLPVVNCANGIIRPWALKYFKENIYVGAVCDASSGTKSDLAAFVFQYDLNANYSSSIVFDFPLTYPKGYSLGDFGDNFRNITGWYPWSDVFSDHLAVTGNGTYPYLVRPTPILADIEFDIDGSMIIALNDRTGLLAGNRNYGLGSFCGNDNTLFEGFVAGDILRAYFNDGTFILENNAKAGPNEGAGVGNNQGPGFGEFYDDNSFVFTSLAHAENLMGGIALLPGSEEVVAAVLDPINTMDPGNEFFAGGVRHWNNSDGSINGSFIIYATNNPGENAGTFAKASGLGDLEVTCDNVSYLQIGNYVWSDCDGDGIQDADEDPIPNVNVTIYSLSKDSLTTVQTDANGEYYFDGTNVPGGLDAETMYFIVFGNNQYDSVSGILDLGDSPDKFVVSIDSTGMGMTASWNDSDIEVMSGMFGGLPFTKITTPLDGVVDHTFDAGFVPLPDLAIVQVVDPSTDVSNLKIGDDVKFLITVHNQSYVKMDSVQITDYIPEGYEFSLTNPANNIWTLIAPDEAVTTISDLNALDIKELCIYLELKKTSDPNNWINVVEISHAVDKNGAVIDDTDVDSELNNDPDDNGGSKLGTEADDALDGDGTATEPDGVAETDQDNVDPAAVPICDLALINKIEDLPGELKLGDTIKYAVIIENQGTVPATNIAVVYSIPDGLSYISDNDNLVPIWNEAVGLATTSIDEVLGVGAKDTICIYLKVENVTVEDVTEDSWTTFAEISSFEDPNDPGQAKSDLDSTPDNDLTNDSGGNPDDDTDDETSGDGTGDPEDLVEDSDPDLDEDDHDPAKIEICDAAIKIYTEEEGPFQYNDTIKFKVVVFNQGNGPITNIKINDFYGSGMINVSTFSNTEAGWSENNGHLMTTSTKVLKSGESDTICLDRQIVSSPSFMEDAYLQIVEIESFEDPENLGVSKEDIDSTPDTNPSNDSGANTNDSTDDFVDGDGTGDPLNPTEDSDPSLDEDDNDPVVVSVFDLALDKKIVDDRSYAPGEQVSFEITVYNQGNVEATSFMLTDYIRDGFSFNSTGNTGWAQVGDYLEYTSSTALAPGEDVVVDLSLTVVVPAMDVTIEDWYNYVEISKADDDNNPNDAPLDADSTPDVNPDNDNQVVPNDTNDDVITENGKAGEDEDDHDPAKVIVGYDLALNKKVQELGPYSYGDTLTYRIAIINQGGLAVSQVEVYDTIPCGLRYEQSLNPAWLYADEKASTTLVPILSPGNSDYVDIRLIVQRCSSPAEDNYYNIAEISDFKDESGDEPDMEDFDSTPDEDPDDDELIDDMLGGPGDEDDHDPEDIEICDLALVNKLVTVPMTPTVGDTVKYEVIVYNQGNSVANSVNIDYQIPNGLGYLDMNSMQVPMWNEESLTLASIATDTAIGPDEQDTVCIYLEIMDVATSEVTGMSWQTIAEITSFTDEDDEVKLTDADSTPDDDLTNDSGGNPFDETDNEIDGDGSGDPNNPADDINPDLDEDDHDPADLYVCDAAVIINTDNEGPFSYGDLVKYYVELHNQGNGEIINVLLQNLHGEGLEFVANAENISAGWVQEEEGELSLLITDSIAPSDTLTICLYMEIVSVSVPDSDTWLQNVEIVQFEDPEEPGVPKHDVDSTPDAIPDNDPGGDPDDETDDETNGDGSGDPEDPNEDANPDLDEDDQDTEDIEICDLALKNTIEELPAAPSLGDTVKYEVVIFNQGNATANSVSVDYLVPNGLTQLPFNATLIPAWTNESDDLASIETGMVLEPGESDTLCIYLEIANLPTDEVTIDSWTTIAEITEYEDEEGDVKVTDIDSNPDDDLSNDPGGNPDDDTDDEVNGHGGGDPNDPEQDSNPEFDEDDNDPAKIKICDVASIIYTEDKQPHFYGKEVKFIVELHNQGNSDITNIELQNLFGEGLEFVVSAENSAAGWTIDNEGDLSLLVDDILESGDTLEICLFMEIVPDLTPSDSSWLQIIEVVGYEDPDQPGALKSDIDSTPDDDPMNDTGGIPNDETDNETTGSGDLNDPNDDEDDHDPVLIDIFDLALIKTTIEDTVYTPGEKVLFHIHLYNQGNLDASSITLIDYLRDGFVFSTNGNTGWNELGDNLEYVHNSTLAVGDSVIIDLELTTIVPDSPDATDWWNYAEISAADDDNNLGNAPPTDSDSRPDDLPDNDNEVNPDDEDDNVYSENGGTGEDEDDHDPAKVIVGYDLALNKTVLETGPYSYGDTLSYRITIYNQGGLPVSNVTILDTLPCGLSFEGTLNDKWNYIDDVASTVMSDILNPGEEAYVDILLIVQPCELPAYNNYYNTAEISDFKDDQGSEPQQEDYDSTPDDDPSNDDVIDEELGGPDDEDDHDPEDIIICDVALSNAIVEQPDAVKVGDEIKYEVVLQNQGNNDVTNITVIYKVPNGLEFLAENETLPTAWSMVNDSILMITNQEQLAPGESDTLCLYLEVKNLETENVTPDSWTTIAEITGYQNEDGDTKYTDADSTPDEDLTNDPGGNPDDDTNDELDGDGTGDVEDPEEDSDPKLDEDDHDPEIIQICDVAAIIYTIDETPKAYYDIIKFNIEVHNQGNGSITNILLQELYGEGWEYVPTQANILAGWKEEGENELALLIDEIIEVGETSTICLELRLIPDFESGEESWLNKIEVVSFENPDLPGEPKTDIDSVPDDIDGNDVGGNPDDDTNDNTNGDGSGDPNDPQDDSDPEVDEDDQDPEDIKVFDLALYIQIDSMPPVLPVVPGDVLKFIIVTTNQGNTEANNVLLSNYLMPDNLIVAEKSNSMGWTTVNDSLSQFTISETLASGSIDTTCIYLEVVNGGMSDIITWAEITGSEETDSDCFDIDSTPNDNNGDDVGGLPETETDDHIEDDGIDGDGNNITDEDDHDPAQIFVQDLALIVWTDHKEPVKVGNDVNFIVKVQNQGNILNDKIKVVTYLPSGFCLSPEDNNGWITESEDLLSVSLPTSLAMGDEVEHKMLLRVKPGANAKSLIIYSEIAGSIDENGMSLDNRDIDSTPDESNTNDNGGEPQDPIDCNTLPTVIVNDNLITGAGKNGEDEDDHDPAWVQVYDLATIIYTNHTQPIIPGDEIKFELELHNQGNMAAEDVELSLYLPNGFSLSVNDNFGWYSQGDRLLKLDHNQTLQPLDVDSLCLVLVVDPGFMLESLIPFVEISGALDTLGQERAECDVDSNSDGNPENDIGGFPDSDDDNLLDGISTMGEDEDDHDPVVPPVLDLAIKIVTVDEAPKVPGDLVKFLVTVYNQGSITPKEFTIENYVPAGLLFENIAQNSGWSSRGDNAIYNYDKALKPFESDSLCIWLKVKDNAHPNNVVDMIEIIDVFDEFNNEVSARDIDSVAESDNDNDKGNELYSVEDNKIHENGRSGGDEDDHDQAFVLLCQEMLCIDQVNISLDSNCETVLSAAMFMKGHLFPDEFYVFTLIDDLGRRRDVRMLTIDDLGKHTIEVYNPICDNKCWGNVLVEYKHLPQIACPVDMTVSCGALDVLPLPDVSGGGACNTSAFTIYLANETREKLECGQLNADSYTHVVTRTYVATDELGNSASCSHMIMLKRIQLTGLEFPGNATINCSDLNKFNLTEEGAPLPWVTPGLTGSGTAGVPVICHPGMDTTTGLVCPSTGSGTGIPLIPQTGATILTAEGPEILLGDVVGNCSAAVIYTDMILPQIGCTKKILRTWEIREWYCGSEFPAGPFVQQIDINDDEAPVITCPTAFVVTTNDDCAGDVVLPPVTANDICDNGVNVTIEHPWGVVTGNGGTAALQVGSHILTYKVTDNCGNGTECSTEVTIRDNTQPVAICEQSTVVSISQDGNTFISSQVLDNGSWDECGEVSTCAMKMEDVLRFRSLTVDTIEQGINYVLRSRMDNGCLQDYVTGVVLDGENYISEDDLCIPYLRFCCTDVGLDQMIIFRASDHGGNFSDCMVSVEVQDKAVPTLVCPEDVSIDCRVVYDLDNLELQFDDVIVEDNCAATQTVLRRVTSDVNQCGIGTIQRTFELEDDFGNIARSCKQEIQLINESPFTGNIEWPLDFEAACGTASQLNPESLELLYAYPRFLSGDDQCTLLGYDYEDQFFEEDPLTGECGHILRSWTVIDWCNQVNGTFVTYPLSGPYVQSIVITNETAPTIEAQDNLMFSSNSIDCISGEIQVARSATDDCTAESAIDWSYIMKASDGMVLTVDNEGNSLVGNSNEITGSFFADAYSIEWTACDGCGNCSTSIQLLEVVNTKAPTPVCMNGLSISLDDNGAAELWNVDIDGGSYHSCENAFTTGFNAQAMEPVLYFDCTHFGVQQVSLYVMDVQTGISDFCIAMVDVQDPLEICTGQLEVAGEVFTEELKYIEEVKVSMAATMPIVMTDDLGQYAFTNMPTGGNYLVKPEKDIAYLNGVSTLDLILIQRHILGLETLGSPYKMVAADVNSSESIDGLDLVELRKLILGIYTELPHNDSWRFIDRDHQFLDELNPWQENLVESYLIDNLSESMAIDFIGVKIGDVNGSAVTSSIEEGVLGRSQRWPVVLEIVEEPLGFNQTSMVKIVALNYERVSGFQGTLEFDPALFTIENISGGALEIGNENFSMSQQDQGFISFSYDDLETKDLENGTELFQMEITAHRNISKLGEVFTLSSSITEAEAYRGFDEVVPLELQSTKPEQTTIVGARPNPWIGETKLIFNMAEAGQGDWEFFDAQGKKVYTKSGWYKAGANTLIVKSQDIETTGIIYVKLRTRLSSVDFKMVKL